jgi:hypothetical protein
VPAKAGIQCGQLSARSPGPPLSRGRQERENGNHLFGSHLWRPKSTTLIFGFPGCGPAISNPMTLFDFKLVAPDRLRSLEMYAASAENVASSRSRYAPPIVSPVVVAGGALQLAQKFPHRRANRDAQ